MRRNTISEGVAAPLPGNRLSALPTNTQLDTAQEHPTNNPLEHQNTRTIRYQNTEQNQNNQNTEGPVHSGAPLILHGGALQLSTRALAQLGTREHQSTITPEQTHLSYLVGHCRALLGGPGGPITLLSPTTTQHTTLPHHHTTYHTALSVLISTLHKTTIDITIHNIHPIIPDHNTTYNQDGSMCI